MIALYIVLGIALLIAAILFTKLKVFVCYEDRLAVYAKILFFKFNIFPEKIKKQKKTKKKKGTKKPPQKAPQPAKKEEKSIVTKLWEMRSILSEIISRFLGKLHFKFLKLHISSKGWL